MRIDAGAQRTPVIEADVTVTRSPVLSARTQRHARKDLLEQLRWRMAEEVLVGHGAIGLAKVKVVHGGERGELAIAEAMAAMVMKRELAVAALDRGAAALQPRRWTRSMASSRSR